MAMLTNDWGYPVAANELNPNDPVVNTGSEYMYQMATVAYHTLHGTQTVVLEEDFTAPDGTVYTAGTPYDVPVDGRYWAAFDRTNPIDAAVRGAGVDRYGTRTDRRAGRRHGHRVDPAAGSGHGRPLRRYRTDLRYRGPRPGLGRAAEKVKVPALQPVATPA